MNKIALILCLSVFCGLQVLSANTREAIEIKANTVLIDERTGVSIYTGDVKATQGQLVLSANEVRLFSRGGKIQKMTAKGDKKQPASYQQNQADQPRFVKASATNITYWIERELVNLGGEVNLLQGVDSFSGDTLDYDIKNDKVIVRKSKNSTDRVRFKMKL